MKNIHFIVLPLIILLTACGVSDKQIKEIKIEVREELQKEYDSKLADMVSKELEKQKSTEVIDPVTEKNVDKTEDEKVEFITEGLSREQVKEIMGTPEKIDSLGAYHYGKSTVSFDLFKKVSGWDNAGGNLKLKK